MNFFYDFFFLICVATELTNIEFRQEKIADFILFTSTNSRLKLINLCTRAFTLRDYTVGKNNHFNYTLGAETIGVKKTANSENILSNMYKRPFDLRQLGNQRIAAFNLTFICQKKRFFTFAE